MTVEHDRMVAEREKKAPWKKWGPYLSERQWGTVREDYSGNGDAWNYFSHDQARSRAYRWGEDGLAGISDDKQTLCFALALWNGKDPIIKERLFGLNNSEGNHGEDVKEYYFYLDSTPTHSYMKYLYKYPHNAYPYDDIVKTNRTRSRHEPEYELLDTGIFDQDRYFDVFVTYAKESPDDVLIQIEAINRGPEAASLHLLPTLWYRNQWSWNANEPRPLLAQFETPSGIRAVRAQDSHLGENIFYCEGTPDLLFTENETNSQRIFGTANATPYVKDGVENYLIHGKSNTVNPAHRGTKLVAHYSLSIQAGRSEVIRLRLTKDGNEQVGGPFGPGFNEVLKSRKTEADAFYANVIPKNLNPDQTNIMRQALAGMLWTKQYYYYDVNKWLEERGSDPFRVPRKVSPRNDQWHHMYNGDIISMPDKWEYPWYAAWDLAFHVISLNLVDSDFGKDQLKLMLREHYQHPNGQIPAYEWNFGDVNPPVHAWATIFTYYLDKAKNGVGDTKWLKSCFQKLLLNFTWWVNRKDRSGRNVFEGGFLGLDNIGVFDRSAPLPTGGYLEQADGTAWMALFADNMLEIAIELALEDDEYEDMVLKFLIHDTWITSSLIHLGDDIGMWDEEDGFFYDVLRLPDGKSQQLKVRSMVGLLPFCAATAFEPVVLQKFPDLNHRYMKFLQGRPELCNSFHDPRKQGYRERRLFSILDESKLRRVLVKLLDENEFLSPYGIRSLSMYHAEHPYVFKTGGQEYRVDYLPGESDSGMFGGNSNWRGPIWIPVNVLILRAFLQYYSYYGNTFTIECPTGSGHWMNLFEVAREIASRLSRIFLKDSHGNRPVYRDAPKFQDPNWCDSILFYEYFHGDTGAGLGASHQTGWTGCVARMLHMFATLTPEKLLEGGKRAYFEEMVGR